jgi:PST family polysaccharide transporter
MAEENKSTSVSNIFKSTFLFGFVQVFNIVVKVGINKVVALLLGPQGMGTISLYQSAATMISGGAGLGISQSAVRDISEANNCNDRQRFSKTISVTNRIILFTSLLGLVLTIAFSPLISNWSFGDNTHIIPVIWLSLMVAFTILSNGQLAILKGMRQLRALAKASMYGSVVGLISAVPFYYFFGEGGIIPSLLVSSFAALFFSNLFVRRISYDRCKLSLIEVFESAGPMVKMGIALMFTSFLISLVNLIVSSYIRHEGGMADVGYYNAGITIIHGYFGIILTALTTDYYPRIAAVNADNAKVQQELHNQTLVSLIICCPIIVLFIALLPVFIIILYSRDFMIICDFVKIAIFGTLITLCSNQVDMILVAKYKINVFTYIAVGFRIIQLGLSVVLYKYFGLIGMGITQVLLGIIHMTAMSIAVYKLYGIKLEKTFWKVWIIVFLLTLLTVGISYFGNNIVKYAISALLVVFSFVFSLVYSKRKLSINVLEILKIRNKK